MLPNFMMPLQVQVTNTKGTNTTNVNFLKIFISKFKSFIATNFHINGSYFYGQNMIFNHFSNTS